MRTQGSAPATSDTISKFNRDTVWLATGILGTVVFAALMIAVQECQRKATEGERDLLLNANPATGTSVIAKSSNSISQMPLGQASCVDRALTENSQQEIPSSQTEPVVSTVLALKTPETNRDGGQAIGARARNASNRSSGSPRYVGVKRRLIELWHQSLAKSETRSWTAFSNLNREERKKAAYMADANH